jgi:hypothetical protein
MIAIAGLLGRPWLLIDDADDGRHIDSQPA